MTGSEKTQVRELLRELKKEADKNRCVPAAECAARCERWLRAQRTPFYILLDELIRVGRFLGRAS